MSMSKIQAELKAPKGQFNSFGKYKYRSCEDIVESVKPVLAQYDYHLTMSDDVVAVLDRVYVKATCRVMDGDLLIAESTAFARESLIKKGMDDSQITGTASSYARKYALNGLFAIDDTKDADTDEHKVQSTKKEPVELDPTITLKFESCQSLDELKELWQLLTPVDRNKYAADKNKAKDRLS